MQYADNKRRPPPLSAALDTEFLLPILVYTLFFKLCSTFIKIFA